MSAEGDYSDVLRSSSDPYIQGLIDSGAPDLRGLFLQLSPGAQTRYGALSAAQFADLAAADQGEFLAEARNWHNVNDNKGGSWLQDAALPVGLFLAVATAGAALPALAGEGGAAGALAEGTAFSQSAASIATAVTGQAAWGSAGVALGADLAEGTAFSQGAATIETAVAGQPAWGTAAALEEGTAFSQQADTIKTAVQGQAPWGAPSSSLIDTVKSGMSNMSNASKAFSAASTVAKVAAGHTGTSGLTSPGGLNGVNQGWATTTSSGATDTAAAAASIPGWVIPALVVGGSVLLAILLKH